MPPNVETLGWSQLSLRDGNEPRFQTWQILVALGGEARATVNVLLPLSCSAACFIANPIKQQKSADEKREYSV